MGELSGECGSCLLEGPALLRLRQLAVKRSGLAEAQRGPDGLWGGVHGQAAPVLVGEGGEGTHVAWEGKEGPEAGVVRGEELLRSRPGPELQTAGPCPPGPALLALAARLTSWQALARGPRWLPVCLGLPSQALCGLNSRPPNPSSHSSRLPACLLPALGCSLFPECPLCPSHCAHLPYLLGSGPMYSVSLKCTAHPAVSCSQSGQIAGASATR